tara:strand:+ start:252 stop:635 length:384 start_codon:yes stop_codon:yes gene_type:complete
MKKTILFLIIITTLTYVSYASFPVNQDAQIEIGETIESPSYGNSPPILGILSLILSLVGLILLFTPAIGTGLLLIPFAIIFGLIGLFKKRSRMLSIASILLSLIILLIGLIIVSMIAMAGVGAAFGG